MKSFIVEFWSRTFYILDKISLFYLICKKFPVAGRSYAFVEGWVLGHLLLSIILLIICSTPNLRWWEAIAVGWGALRVWEVVIYQINVLLFGEYRARTTGKVYALRGYRRIVILLLHNYVEFIFWFALFYRNMDWAFETGRVALNSFFVSLNFSFAKMTTFGYTAITPSLFWGNVVVLIQSAIGLFMALLILARFVSMIPKPETLDEFER